VAQDANLTQLLDHFQTLVFFLGEDQGDLLKQDLLVVTSKAVVENLAVALHSGLQMLKRLFCPHDDALGEHGTGVRIRVVNQLFRGVLAVQSIDDDQGRWLVKLCLCIFFVSR